MAAGNDTTAQEYMLAVILGNQTKGATFVGWPAHITLVPWFHIDEPVIAETALYQSIKTIAPFKVSIVGEGMFGHNANLPVYLLEKSPELMGLYLALTQSLKEAGATFKNESYTGEQFVPHITKKLRWPMHVGQEIEVTAVHFIAAPIAEDPRVRTKKVVEVAGLHG